jgi:NADPH:quinone reductase
MRALVVESFTGPDGVTVREVPDPSPAEPGSVLVEVKAAALGSWDIGTSYGGFAGMGGATALPQVIGWDFAGVRADTGERVAGFVAQPWAGVGTAAPRAVVPEGVLAPVPDGLSDEAAATLAVTALTARLALDTAGQPRGGNLLVIGAAGAVGAVVVALAAAQGLVVAGSAGPEDADRIRAAGGVPLDRHRDLAEQYAAAGLISPDAVIDFVGGEAGSAAMELLQDGAGFVSATPNSVPPAVRGIQPHVISVQSDGGRLAALLPRFASGELPVPRFEAVPLAESAEAFRRLAAGRTRGKVVVVP